jgi:hypothetical protein
MAIGFARLLAFRRESGPARQLFNGIAEQFIFILRRCRRRFAIDGALQIPPKFSNLITYEPMKPRSKACLTSGLSSSNPNRARADCQPVQTKHSSCGCKLP